jgi:hypothetical protein
MPWHFPARCEPQIELRLVAARNPTKFFSRDPENLQRPQVWAAAFVRQSLSESDEAYATDPCVWRRIAEPQTLENNT